MLDEIELALHPSSLKRLVRFLKEISNTYNYAVYFSTHSLELISSTKPDNIFFLQRHVDNSLELINPCYPAYATRILVDIHSGFDYIILVEDDLSKEVVERIIRDYSLRRSKMIYVLPCGGFTNVIRLAQEVIDSNLATNLSNISIILDADIKEKAINYLTNQGISNNVPMNFLPIESLEKFLKANLFDKVDHNLLNLLDSFIFQKVGLKQIADEYRNNGDNIDDNDCKKFFGYIDKELRARNKTRNDLVEMIVKYLADNNSGKIERLVNFLETQFNRKNANA